jgi:hypothetical protein
MCTYHTNKIDNSNLGERSFTRAADYMHLVDFYNTFPRTWDPFKSDGCFYFWLLRHTVLPLTHASCQQPLELLVQRWIHVFVFLLTRPSSQLLGFIAFPQTEVTHWQTLVGHQLVDIRSIHCSNAASTYHTYTTALLLVTITRASTTNWTRSRSHETRKRIRFESAH